MPSKVQYPDSKNYLPIDSEEYCYRILKPNGDFWSRNRMNKQYGDILTNCNQIAEMLDKNPDWVLIKCYLRDVGKVKMVRWNDIQIGDIVKYAENGIGSTQEIKRANYYLSTSLHYKVINVRRAGFKTMLKLSGASYEHRSTLFEKVG